MLPLIQNDWMKLLYLITFLFMVILIVQQRGDPLKTIAWLLVVAFLPVIGVALYFFFGKNYRKEKLFSRKGLSDSKQIKLLTQYQSTIAARPDYWADDSISGKAHIMKMLYNSDKALLTEYNRVKILVNGKETFGAIIDALQQAVNHIHLEYYIIEDDKIGNIIREILIEKAQNGVEVRVIYDDIGCWSLSNKYITSLKEAGVKIFPFMPVRMPFLTNKINYRNHRKIIVVDGTIGFVGGLNIADRYISGSEEIGPWRDTHLQIEGEAVYSLQSIFLLDWFFAGKQNIHHHNKYFPPCCITERHLIQIVASGPDSDWASIMQTYFMAAATAKESICISTPYFMPNESILTAIRSASLSGVDVRILLPKRSDSKLVAWSTNSYISELLEAGIKVYLYEKGFPHSKLMIIDDVFCSVGTANMDIRSFDQNFEINAIIYDRRIATAMRNIFENDIKGLKSIHAGKWSRRPKWVVFRESIARLFSPLL
ncbi:MAG: cardiolipin synthase [Bacteroidales bacterium]|jgi:cardiolipin synthase|nr:cardiolipin synthase [Bacteroidales bacterium]